MTISNHNLQCAPSVPVKRYRAKRICISPDTKTIKIGVQRCGGFKTQEKSIDVSLLIDDNDEPLKSYAFLNGIAYFDVSKTNPFKEAKLYKVKIKLFDTVIGYAEIVNASPFSMVSVSTVESECGNKSNWVEPQKSEEEKPPCYDCDPPSCGMVDLCIPDININKGY